MSRGASRTPVRLADAARNLSRQRSLWQGLVDFAPSSLAAASLQDLGIHRATDVIGGYAAWRAHAGS